MKRRSFLASSLAVLAGCSGGSGHPVVPRSSPSASPSRPISVPPRQRLGLVVHNLRPGTLARCRALNVTRLRFTVYWYEWSFPAYRAEVTEWLRNAEGFDLLLVLHGAGDDLNDYLRFVQAVHAIAPRAGIQPWNEVDSIDSPGNGWQHFVGSPGRYVDHLQAVRAAVPGAFLVSAGLASTGEDLAGWVEAIDAAPVDVVAVHVYGWPLILPYREKAAIARQHTDRPVYCTEFGEEKAVLPPDLKHLWPSDQVEQLRQCAESSHLYDRSYVFVLDDGAGGSHSLTAGSAAWLAMWNG